MRYITAEDFQDIQALVADGAPAGSSKVERDAFAMLLASILEEKRAEEARQQQRGKKRRNRRAA